MNCPPRDQLRQLLGDELTGDTQRTVQAHLEGCPTCQQVIERLAAAGPSWDRAARHLADRDQPTGPALADAVARLQAADLTPSTPPAPADGIETQAELRPSAADEFAFLEPPTEPGQLGRLGYYTILEIVGRGGMGVVFKARDERLQRIVAIKVLGPQYATSAAARRRFQREATTAAAVSHDHVVPIYQVDHEQGISYLVMPLIQGVSLQERLERAGPLALPDLLRIGAQIARGLAAAHKQNLIHRDIKPANILLEHGSERVKITDFGLARAIDDASITQSGVITGTPMFMSPEQARGDVAIDARSDLFSLGSVLYMMGTGRAPFRAAGTHAVIHRVIHDTPQPMRDFNPDIPDWLEAIVARLHAKHPGDRFASAEAVADVIEQHLAHLHEPRRVQMPPPITLPTPSSPRLKPRPKANTWSRIVIILGVVFATTACGIGLFFCGAPVGLALLSMVMMQPPHDRAPILDQAVGPGQEAQQKPIPGWGVLVDPAGGSHCLVENDRLSFRVPGGMRRHLNPLPAWNLEAPRVTQDRDGDFVAQVKIVNFGNAKPHAALAGNAQDDCAIATGLLVWRDAHNFVRVERASGGKVAGDRAQAIWFKNGKKQAQATVLANDIIYLRIERRAGELKMQHSKDGLGWAQGWVDFALADTTAFEPKVYKTVPLPDRVTVGVFAINATQSEYAPILEGFELDGK